MEKNSITDKAITEDGRMASKNKTETTFEAFLDEQLKDAEFKAEWDALEPEFSIVQALIDARVSSGLTQSELAKKTGIAQGDISKIENGNGNPSIKTLKRLAEGMGKNLKIEFVDVKKKNVALHS